MSEPDLLDDDSSGIIPIVATSDPARKVRVCHVLVIEDNRADYVFVEYYLKKAEGIDFRLQRAVRLADGLAILATGGIDLVLLDLVLPDSEGWETLRRLRMHAPDVPVIVLTGLDDESAAIEAVREGAQDYLIKGKFDGYTLVRSVRYALARHRARAKVELALRRVRASEANLRNLISSSLDGTLVVDQHGGILFSNPAAQTLLGGSAEPLEGTAFGFPLVAGQKAEVQIVQDGFRTVPVEMRTVAMEWEGQPAFRVMLRDLTDQKLAEAEHAQLAAIVQATDDAVVRTDLGGVLQNWNRGAEKTFGYSAAEAIGRNLAFLAAPDQHQRFLEVIERVHRGETVSQGDLVCVHRDGRKIDVLLSAFPIRDKQGDIASIGSMIRDTTLAKQNEYKLRIQELQLQTAQAIQQHLLPTKPPCVPGFDIAGALYPAQFAAGDYFDYLPMRDGSLGLAIGDVSGHGFASALLMAATSAYLQSLVHVSDDIVEILRLLNRILVARTPAAEFVTLVLAQLDYETRSLAYTSAGHSTGYVLDSSGELKARLESTAMPLAIFEENEFLAGVPVQLDAGDTVVLLTDGFLEARSPSGDYFWEQGVLQVVRDNRHSTAREIIECLYRAVQGHAQKQTLDDDLTAVVVKVEPHAGNGRRYY